MCIDKIRGWKYYTIVQFCHAMLEPIGQTFILPVAGFIIYKIKIANMLSDLLEDEQFTSILEIAVGIVAKFGNAFFAMAAVGVLYIYIRKKNKDKILFENHTGYHEYPLAAFWYCAKVLGYGSVNLKFVPNYLQLQLVGGNVFQEYSWGSDAEYPPIENENIIVQDNLTENENITLQDKLISSGHSTVNLVLEDTFQIKDDLLPRNTSHAPQIRIKREKSGNRQYSQSFVDKVESVILTLPANITTINIFSTLNPLHAYRIGKKVLQDGDRRSVCTINIYRQKRGTWKFQGIGARIHK